MTRTSWARLVRATGYWDAGLMLPFLLPFAAVEAALGLAQLRGYASTAGTTPGPGRLAGHPGRESA